MRELVGVATIWVVCVIIAIGIWFGAATAGLVWMPFYVQQQTKIVRASNGYITAQQEELRNLDSHYFDPNVTPDQKKAIIHQMQETADLIPGNVQPDIADFLAQHSN
jgi:hypothetical protein